MKKDKGAKVSAVNLVHQMFDNGHLKQVQRHQELAKKRIASIRKQLDEVEEALNLSADPTKPNVEIKIPHIDYLHESVMHLQDHMRTRRLYLSYLGHKVWS